MCLSYVHLLIYMWSLDIEVTNCGPIGIGSVVSYLDPIFKFSVYVVMRMASLYNLHTFAS